MNSTRRTFLGTLSAAATGVLFGGAGRLGEAAEPAGGAPEPASAARAAGRGRDEVLTSSPGASHDPWLELDPAALVANAAEVARVAGGRPVMAVVKNNAYGLGLERVGPVLDRHPAVAGLAVVKVDEALRLRDAGARKPILFMGLASDEEAEALVRRDVRLAPFSDDDVRRLPALARRLQRRVPIHFYIDTGMSRLGIPYHRALSWMEALASAPGIDVEGAFQTFAESTDHDPDQLGRFMELARAARARNVPLGRLHAASSNAVTFLPESHLDMVRPGLMLYGAQVAGGRDAGVASLRPAFRLRARVVRVERLRRGDAVSYGRNYVAEAPVWIATLPVGHADGYPRQAVQGCQVLIDGRLYPVIGAVSASHTIIEVGEARRVEAGDVATLVGPDHPDIHPNTVSERTGRSVYDILMHLSPELPARSFAAA